MCHIDVIVINKRESNDAVILPGRESIRNSKAPYSILTSPV